MKNQLISRLTDYNTVPAPVSKPVNRFKATSSNFTAFPSAVCPTGMSAQALLLVPHSPARAMLAQQELIAHKAYSVSRVMACYALDLTDDALCEAITISRAELVQEKPQHLIMIAAKLLAKAHTLLDELEPYGLTSNQLADLDGEIRRLVKMCKSNSQA
ncbi:MAG: hypothetical protein NTW29_13310 [Bacteroidetes bacterium]|nr:hypothetical protein [Bacteroidota bacterium]